MKSKSIVSVTLLSCVATLFALASAIAADNVLRDDPYASRKQFYEEHWQKKIEAVLRYVDGAVVAVNVTLTTDIEKSVRSETFDGVRWLDNAGHSKCLD